MKFNIKKYLFSLLGLIAFQSVSAQFSITESFKNNYTETDTEIGGDAILTGNGTVDPKGDGWLRLTPAIGNKRGFAYVNKPFPSTQGVIVEFDYKTWGGNGADGFVVYLFDAKYGPSGTNLFKTGGYGGSLGYAQQNTTPGLTGGYIGVGFDEWGNFALSNEGKNGGLTGEVKSNYITIRGKESNYTYLNSVKYDLGIASSSTTRPLDTNFYRRVKIKIEPINSIYRITVYVKSDITGNYVQQITTDYNEKPFEYMKLGFAASTGGNHNYHEIRNVITTTPGGLRVFKSANKNLVATTAQNDHNKLTYTINVTNDSNFQLNQISFQDIIKDGNGNQLTTNQFQVESISLSNFVDNSSGILTNNANKITGNLKLGANAEGTVTVTGKLLEIIPERKIINTISAYATDLTESDLTNNVFSVTTNLVPPVIGSSDAFEWQSTILGAKTYDILKNDMFEGGTVGAGFILSDTSKNVTITPKGTWPSGISINSSGQISVTQGTTRPTIPIYYTICNNNNECVDVEVIFNTIDAGTITSINNIVCYGNNVIVNKGATPLLTYYTWQISTDNGVTWNDASDRLLAGSHKDLEISSIKQNSWIRRKAEPTSGGEGYSSTIFIQVIHNEISFSSPNDFSVPINTDVVIPNITTTYPSKVRILDSNDNEVQQGATVSFDTTGVYTYTVKVERLDTPSCPVYSSIDINVYDLGSCDKTKDKIMVKTEDWSTVPVLIIPGVVSNGKNAVDNDLSTHSTITIPVGLLGLGTTWHNLRFDHNVKKGTPLTVKLGQEYSAIQVGGGVTVQALDVNGNTIGPLLAAGDGALLDLLVGDNVFEYTFVPKDNNGNLIDYKGVRVIVGSTLAVANNAKLFGAYYEKDITIDLNNPTCSIGKIVAGASKPSGYPHTNVTLNPMVNDVLWGVEDVGLGVASSLASIVYPYLAADNDLDTYAIFNKSVAALNRQKLTVKFNQIARPGDQVRILMGGFEVPVLDLSLLTDIKVQRYLGDVKVGAQIDGSQFKILDLNLLALLGSVGNRKALIVDAISQPFDRVEISYLSTVQVGLLGDYTYIYDVALKPNIAFDGQLPNNPDGTVNTTQLCALDFLRVEKPDLCSDYEIAFAYANKDAQGNVISFTDITNSGLTKVSETNTEAKYQFNSIHGLHTDNLYLKVRVHRQGCPFGDYQYIKVNIVNCQQAIVNPVLKLGATK